MVGNKNKTALCIGPLSTNIIDTAIEFSNVEELPLIFVASRRQIDSRELGGGYVNNWTTEELVSYVSRNNGKNIIFERDHGGPWQGNYEVINKLSVDESMKIAKNSFEADIDAGMQILHIDPTISVNGEQLTYEKILSRLFEIYGHVSEYAKMKNKEVFIEVGTEEQSGSYTDLDKLEEFLNQIEIFCKNQKLEMPLFLVIQTGAKVIENRNIGLFERGNKYDKAHLIKNIKEASKIANSKKIFIKEHNADYLSFENLCMRPSLGISGSNVAPELGCLETKVILNLLNNFGEQRDYEEFVSHVHSSMKWVKWVLPESNLKMSEKAILAGHYCFADDEIVEIKNRLREILKQKNINLESYIRKAVRASLYKYASSFGLLK